MYELFCCKIGNVSCYALCIIFNVNAKCTKILDAVIPIKVLQTSLLGADKIVPVLDGALVSAFKVFSVITIIVRNQIYAGKYVTKLISKFGCRQIIASIGCSIIICIQSNSSSCNYSCCMQNYCMQSNLCHYWMQH